MDDSDSDFNPRRRVGNDLVFLARWKARSAKRRAQLAAQLSSITVGPQRKENLKIWLKNLQARRMWLEARLDHLKGTEEIVAGALKRN